jgi:hypothetical protein
MRLSAAAAAGSTPAAIAASRTSAPSTSSSSVVVHAPMNAPSSLRPASSSIVTTLSGENGLATMGPSLASAMG